MDSLKAINRCETLNVRFEEDLCFMQIHRPDAANTICDRLVEEFVQTLDACQKEVKIVVVEGLPEIFCLGADFKELRQRLDAGRPYKSASAEALYDLWQRLATGPFITIAHIRGKVNAGGIGFVAACDIALCEEISTFSLSEMLFGLLPACVMPFLIRRMGRDKSNYMTLMTQPVSAETAKTWGLVDAYDQNSQNLLRLHLLRLRRLTKINIVRYKQYMKEIDDFLSIAKPKAVAANLEVFSDPRNMEHIARYVETGQFTR